MKVIFKNKYGKNIYEYILHRISNNQVTQAISILVLSFNYCYPFVVGGGAIFRHIYYIPKTLQYYLIFQNKPPPKYNYFH